MLSPIQLNTNPEEPLGFEALYVDHHNAVLITAIVRGSQAQVGIVRQVQLKASHRVLRRPIVKLCSLQNAND